MLVFFIVMALLLSALFSGTEIAFISASKIEIELKKMQGSRRSSILADFYDEPSKFLSTMLVGNNLALVLFSIFMTKLIEPVLKQYVAVAEVPLLLTTTLVITIVVLIFGEFLPKTLFRLFSNRILYVLAYPLMFLSWILVAPAWIMNHLSNWLLRVVFRTPVSAGENVITRLDLEDFIKGTKLEHSEEEIDADLFGKALHLRSVKVKECMVPRTEIVDIDIIEPIEQLKDVFAETKLSRILVTENEIDNVQGYVHHQQLFNKPQSIRSMVLDVPFVPEAMRVRDLMDKFIKERMNIACVVDEYGGISGVITLEDILEEIFGEIEDEHDYEDLIEQQVSENEYILAGRLEVDYLSEKYDALVFPEGEYHTLSGFLVDVTQHIPEQGDQIDINGYRFIPELVSDTKIETVRVIKLPKSDEEVD
ncbi:MAG: HlyC/CorC family transporter [Saprospiraceae bacterium]|nr:HlyC/CorC family transporter [Saprospiraceae bacterium]